MIEGGQQAHAGSLESSSLQTQGTSEKRASRILFPSCLSLFSATGPCGIFLLLLLLLAGFATPVSALNFNAAWLYRETGGESIPTRRDFTQRYVLGLGGGLTYQPSHAITASGSVSYTGSQSDSGGGFNENNYLTPRAGVTLTNDIFRASLAGESSIVWRESFQSTQNSWNVSLGSMWDIPLWPTLRLNYSEYAEPVQRISFFESDQITKNSSLRLYWDLILADFTYTFNNRVEENSASNITSESDSHFAKVETNGSFLDRRFNYAFSQQFNYTESDIGFEDEGEFDLAIEGLGFAKVDLETDPDPPDPIYVDPNLPLPQVVAIDERVHFRFITDNSFPEQIDILRLELPDSFTVPQALGLQWDIYIRSDQFDDWELVDALVQGEPTLDQDNSIDIPINLNVSEVLVVAVNDSISSLAFVALDAFTRLTGNFARTRSNYLTNFSMGYRFTRSLQATAGLTLEHSETESAGPDYEFDRQGITGSLRWAPLPFVRPSLNFSEFTEQATNAPEKINRTYSLNVATLPLPSLNLSFSVTHNENLLDNLLTTSSNRYSVNAKAPIYPDLTASWSLSYTERENLGSDNLYKPSNTLTSRLNLNAQLFKYLRAEFLTGYSRQKSDFGSSQRADALFGLIYRPSQFLNVRSDYTTYFLDNKATDRFNLRVNLTLLRTPKTHLDLNANHSQAERTNDTLGLTGSWTISRYLTFITSGNYRITAPSTYFFRGTLTFRL